MKCQVEKSEHFRHLLLYEFNRGSKAAEAARNISAVYGEDSIAERISQKWFARFKQGNLFE
jgi:glucan phosphorylase